MYYNICKSIVKEYIMKKRMISFCLLLTLLFGLVSGISVSAESTDLSVPQTAIFVDLTWTESTVPASATFGGTTVNLTWNENAFADAQDALDAAPIGGTVVLRPGTYSTAFIIKKSVTLLGAKAGIDPNTKGDKATDDWTLTTGRGSDETIITAVVHMGVYKETAYADATDITVDGVMLSAGGQLRSNCGDAGSANLTLKNIYVKDSTISTGPFFLMPYYCTDTANGNQYQRNVTIAAVRYENQDNQALALSADSADISGVYMDETSDGVFLPGASASTASTAAVTWNIHDCMFCNPVHRVMTLNWDTAQVTSGKDNALKLNTALSKREKVTTKVEGCVFYNCFNPDKVNTIYFRTNLDTVYYEFTDNIFYNTVQPKSSHVPLAGYSTKTRDYSDQLTIQKNQFIGKFSNHWLFANSGGYVDLSGNYCEDAEGNVTAMKTQQTKSRLVKQDWWYADRSMTTTVYADTVEAPGADATFVDLESDVKWLGRTYAEGDKHYFNWSSSGFEFNFTGTAAYATLHCTNNYAAEDDLWKYATAYLWVYVDGVKTQLIQLTDETERVILAEGLEDGEHTIKVVKRVNGRSNRAAVSQIWVNEGGNVEMPNRVAGRKMQFVGDSITVGYGAVNSASGTYDGITGLGESTWTVNGEDSTMTYVALAARYFGADNHTIAISGRGIVKNNGGTTNDLAPKLYEYTDWNNKAQWDHSTYQPDVIVINYGTNDSSSSANVSAEDFKVGCKAFIEQVRGQNPNAYIIYAYGFMGNTYDTVIREVVAQLNETDSKIYYLPLTAVSDDETSLAHPTAEAHADRSTGLIELIAQITGWDEHTTCSYEKTTLQEATCTAEGVDAYVCSVCGDTYTETVATVPHVASETITPYEGQEATCYTDGLGYKKCTGCNYKVEENLKIAATNEHVWAETLTQGETSHYYACTTDGCTAKKDEAAHEAADELVVDTAPTCAKEGIGHSVCKDCGKTLEENKPIAATGKHVAADELVVDTAATCGQDGVGHSVCKTCGTTMEENLAIAATGKHSYDKGVVTVQPTTTKEGVKTYTCGVCGDIKTEKIAKTKPAVSFIDVKKSDYFYNAVVWAVEKGVTTGTSKTEFSPEDSCTRAQAVTFLWRAAGSPAPKSSNNPFKDVKKSDYYYKAVLWAVENGITKGTSATAFSPEESCTRGQIVTFLWRAQSGKKVSATNPFTDVKSGDYYYNAVLWAVKNDVTTGTSAKAFSPADTCTRGQIVTFLYRAMEK